MPLAKPSRLPKWLAVLGAFGVAVFFLSARAEQQAAAVLLRLIVVNSASEAESLLAQLKAGADFAVLAREKSVDATSIDGGMLGALDPATLRSELRDALRGTLPG